MHRCKRPLATDDRISFAIIALNTFLLAPAVFIAQVIILALILTLVVRAAEKPKELNFLSLSNTEKGNEASFVTSLWGTCGSALALVLYRTCLSLIIYLDPNLNL